MAYASSHVVGWTLSRLESCSRVFPDECKLCQEYVETYPAFDVGLAGCFGLYFGPSYIVRRCKRFNWKSCEEIRR